MHMTSPQIGLRESMTNPELRLWAGTLNALPIPVAVTDTGGELLLANAAWQALDLPAEAGEHVHAARVLRVHAAPSEDGRVLWAEDVTELRQMAHAVEQERGALLAASEESARTRRDLAEVAAVSSHDLKTAMRGISLLAQWIGEDLGDRATTETKQHIDLLRARVSRTEAIIEALSRYLRLGDTDEEPVEVDTGALLDSITRKLAPPDAFTIKATTPMPVLTTTRTELRQALSALIENAITHHDREDGTISVEAHDRGGHYEICVVDDGPGLGEHTHERVFRLFRTGGGALEPVGHVGIGLALVKRVVEGRGGTVSVKPAPNRGSAFCFTWPKVLRPERDA
jgi:signal transduction histidine kinase